jgi:TetR/AcrR family transcriptional regulator, fatty acid metabolism regulator protein
MYEFLPIWGGASTMQIAHMPRSLKERQRQEREALILQVAEEVLVEKGYHETSMDEIAARVGVAKGTVYLHFPSKEDLVVAVFARDMQKFLQAVEAAIEDAAASELTARAKLEAVLHFMYGGLFSKRAQLLYTMYNNADLRRFFLEKGTCMRDMWEHLATRITALLEEGKAAGEFDTSLPTNVMLSAFFSLLSPRSYDRLLVGAHISPDELAMHLGRIYFKGIAATK